MATTISNLPLKSSPGDNDNFAIDDVTDGNGKRVRFKDIKQGAGTYAVDNVSAMQSITPPSNSDHRFTFLGYDIEGDGGNGDFFYDADRPKSDHNGGTVFSDTWNNGTWKNTQDPNWYKPDPNDTGTGCWVRLISGDIVDARWFGANNGADSYYAIQAAIDLSAFAQAEVALYEGAYSVSQPINIPNKNTFTLASGATIRPSGDHDCIHLNSNALLKGDGRIGVGNVAGYSSSAISVIEASGLNEKRTGIDGVQITNSGQGTGTAISLISQTEGKNIAFGLFKDITIRRFNQAILLKSTGDDTGTPFVNSNSFVDITILYCRNYIRLEGGADCQKNIFKRIVIEAGDGDAEKAVELLGGVDNEIDIVIWDWAHAIEDIAVLVSADARYSRVAYTGVRGIDRNYSDTSDVYNKVDVATPMQLTIPPAQKNRAAYTEMNDILAYVDETGTVTTNQNPSVGQLKYIFQHTRQLARWNLSVIDDEFVTVDIDLPQEYDQVDVVGINFNAGWAKYVKIEVFSNTDSAYHTVFEDTDNQSSSVHATLRVFDTPILTDHVGGVRFTLNQIATNSANNFVEVMRLYAYSRQSEGGAFITKSGGNIYGDINSVGVGSEGINHILSDNSHVASDDLNTYPDGISAFVSDSGSDGFPGSQSLVTTFKPSDRREGMQFVSSAQGTNVNNVHIRTYKLSSQTWNDFVRVGSFDGGSTRPVSPVQFDRFFDTSIGKPIWFDGTNWVDATGAIV